MSVAPPENPEHPDTPSCSKAGLATILFHWNPCKNKEINHREDDALTSEVVAKLYHLSEYLR